MALGAGVRDWGRASGAGVGMEAALGCTVTRGQWRCRDRSARSSLSASAITGSKFARPLESMAGLPFPQMPTGSSESSPVPSHYKYGQSGADCVAVAQRRLLHFPAIQERSVAAIQIVNPAGGTFPAQRKVCAGHVVIINDGNVTLGASTNFDGLPHWHSNLLSQQGAPFHLKGHIHQLFCRWKVLHTWPIRLVQALIGHTAYPSQVCCIPQATRCRITI